MNGFHDIMNGVDLAGVPTIVRVRTVVVNGEGLIASDLGDVGSMARKLRGGLRDPLHAAAVQSMLEISPHLVSISARLKGVDALTQALVQQGLDVGHRIVLYHLPVQLGREVRKPAQRVASADQAGHLPATQINCW